MSLRELVTQSQWEQAAPVSSAARVAWEGILSLSTRPLCWQKAALEERLLLAPHQLEARVETLHQA
ncbi:MAG: hypothetical protein Q7T10_02320 [Rhodoferax sp.]|nr:hypothetical protein [Rhodoferax sp.]